VRRFLLLAGVLLALGLDVQAATSQVVKVLPHLLDQQKRSTLHPSLYERDAYQKHLRDHPELCSGLRFDVHWKVAKDAFPGVTLRIEARGTKPVKAVVLETPLEPQPWYKRWTSLQIDGEAYRQFGELVAWRATLWRGDTLLAEQKSFLW
jgi:methyl coenzyme M reductase gamma subunit